MIISIIVAASENGVIGRAGALPWRLSNDLQRFKQITMGHTAIMGRRTWESIGRPLPGRKMIVISRRPDYCVEFETVQTAHSLEEAFQIAADSADDEAFIIGGAELYRAALPRANRIYLTRVHAEVEGDTHLPTIDWSEWRQAKSHRFPHDAKNDFDHTLEVYERSA